MSGTLLRWTRLWSDRRRGQQITCEPPAGARLPVEISVVIPTVGRTGALANLLQSLRQQSMEPVEVIVVDQNESDLLGPLLAVAGLPSLIRVRLPEANAAAARNAGFVVSTGSHILFVDDDEILEPDFLAKAAATFRAYPFIGCLWPILYVGDDPGSAIRHWKRLATGEHLAGTSLFAVHRTGSGGVAFERDVFRRSGGYDELMFQFAGMSEDWELSSRMRARGLTMWCDSSLFLRHQPATEGGCETRSLECHEVRTRVARACFFKQRAARGESFRLRLRDAVPLVRYVFLSSFGRSDAYRDLVRSPLRTLRMLFRATEESRRLLEANRDRYAVPGSVDHLDRHRHMTVSQVAGSERFRHHSPQLPT